MAFTETQEDQIRQYLGFAAGFYQYNSRLESMIDKVGDNAVEKASVEALMAKLATVETALLASGSTSTARGSLKRADDIEFYPVGEDSAYVVTARSYGNILINRLAARFGYSRDELPSQFFGTGAGGGGEIQLG